MGPDPKADGFTGSATGLLQVVQDSLINTEMVEKGSLFDNQKAIRIISAVFIHLISVLLTHIDFIPTVLKHDLEITFLFSGELQISIMRRDFPFLFPASLCAQLFLFLLGLPVSFIHFPPFSHTLSIILFFFQRFLCCLLVTSRCTRLSFHGSRLLQVPVGLALGKDHYGGRLHTI